jgi:hypothetical protein
MSGEIKSGGGGSPGGVGSGGGPKRPPGGRAGPDPWANLPDCKTSVDVMKAACNLLYAFPAHRLACQQLVERVVEPNMCQQPGTKGIKLQQQSAPSQGSLSSPVSSLIPDPSAPVAPIPAIASTLQPIPAPAAQPATVLDPFRDPTASSLVSQLRVPNTCPEGYTGTPPNCVAQPDACAEDPSSLQCLLDTRPWSCPPGQMSGPMDGCITIPTGPGVDPNPIRDPICFGGVTFSFPPQCVEPPRPGLDPLTDPCLDPDAFYILECEPPRGLDPLTDPCLSPVAYLSPQCVEPPVDPFVGQDPCDDPTALCPPPSEGDTAVPCEDPADLTCPQNLGAESVTEPALTGEGVTEQGAI